MNNIVLSNGVERPIDGYVVYQVTPKECERCVSDAFDHHSAEATKMFMCWR